MIERGCSSEMQLSKKKKALSTIVATVLMINVSILMGAMYMAWMSGLLGTYTGDAQVQYNLMEARRSEWIVVENVWFQQSNKITVFVRNVGVMEANIVRIYINGQALWAYNTTNLPYTLLVGRRSAFELTYAWTSGSTYSFSVATSRGNQARGDWVP